MSLFSAFKIGSKALALACGAIISFSAFAESIPATYSPGTGCGTNSAYESNSRYGCAASDVCVLNVKPSPSGNSLSSLIYESHDSSVVRCVSMVDYQTYSFPYSVVPARAEGYYCPDSTWSLNGQTCTRPDITCKEGQYSQDGVCKCESGAQIGNDGTCCPTAADGAPSMQWCYVQTASATSCDSSNGNGCGIRCSGVTFQLPKGDSLVVFPALALGQGCKFTGSKSVDSTGGGPLSDQELDDVKKATKTPEAVKTPAGCLAAGMGYVTSGNGTTSCVDSGDNGTVKKTTEEHKENDDGSSVDKKGSSSDDGQSSVSEEIITKTNPDGSKTIERVVTRKNPDGSVSVERSVESYDPEGNKTGTKTSNSDQTQQSFCDENPNSPMCKEQKDLCVDHPDRAGCVEMGTPSDSDVAALQTEQRGETISIIPFNTSETCPADIALPRGMSFSWGPICTGASWLKPVILAFAWLTAGLIIVGAFRES